MKLTPALRSTLITFASFIFVITAVSAWTGPSVSAPDGNVSAPLTISATSQSKAGGLDVGWLSAVGAVKVGYTATACSAELAGSLRWNTGVMEYCNGTVWGPFVGSGTGGGRGSLYCKFTGKSASVSSTGIYGPYSMQSDCSISVDSSGYETITANTRAGAFGSCSDSASQSDTVICNSQSQITGGGEGDVWTSYGRTTASFNRENGVLTCTTALGVGSPATDYGSNSTTITPDPSLCNSGGGEIDPTVPPSVKDGTDWSEVTGKPTALKGAIVAGCEKNGGCWGGIGNGSAADPAMRCPAGSTGRSMYQARGGEGDYGYHSYFCVQD